MSTATPTAPAPAPARPLIEQMEQAYCVNDACGAVIPPEMVFRNLDRKSPTRETARTVKAYCQHCDRAYEVRQVLRGGVWHNAGDVEVVTDAKRRRGILARVAHVRGEMQLAQD